MGSSGKTKACNGFPLRDRCTRLDLIGRLSARIVENHHDEYGRCAAMYACAYSSRCLTSDASRGLDELRVVVARMSVCTGQDGSLASNVMGGEVRGILDMWPCLQSCAASNPARPLSRRSPSCALDWSVPDSRRPDVDHRIAARLMVLRHTTRACPPAYLRLPRMHCLLHIVASVASLMPPSSLSTLRSCKQLGAHPTINTYVYTYRHIDM